MFENLSRTISQSMRKVFGVGRLTENNIKEALYDVRVSLLEGDVELSVVNSFINHVKQDVIGKKINNNLTPGQEFVKIIHSALVRILGEHVENLNLNVKAPAIIMLVGMQGSGKTTTVGKLARFLKLKYKKRVCVVSIDVKRPAGIKQLSDLVSQEKVFIFPSCKHDKPLDIIDRALVQSRLKLYDVLIVDTYGCLDTDIDSLSEISEIYSYANPIETLFIVDSMIGKIAANVVTEFNKVIKITGIVLTKIDGDSRGGAALSIPYITKKPIKFIGVGETIDSLELFYPERIASRILGMGDMLSLIEDIQSQAKKVQKKKNIFSKNKNSNFDFYDFLEYIKQIRGMGGISKIFDKLPSVGVGEFFQKAKSHINDQVFINMEVIINSMTPEERMNPEIIKGSRKRRIALGSGVHVQEVSKLLNQFYGVRATVKQIRKTGMVKTIQSLKNKISSNFLKH